MYELTIKVVDPAYDVHTIYYRNNISYREKKRPDNNEVSPMLVHFIGVYFRIVKKTLRTYHYSLVV